VADHRQLCDADDPATVAQRIPTHQPIAQRVGPLPQELIYTMGLDNPIHIAFLLILLLLVFGAKRLPEMGRSLGGGMRGFKESLTGDTVQSTLTAQQPAPAPTVAATQAAAPLATPVATPVAAPAAAPAEPVLASVGEPATPAA
jgi:sec-independent protein translocase protein TatA